MKIEIRRISKINMEECVNGEENDVHKNMYTKQEMHINRYKIKLTKGKDNDIQHLLNSM